MPSSSVVRCSLCSQVDVVDMTMAKTESEIAANYDQQLVASLAHTRDDVDELLSIGQELRDDLANTKEELLDLQGYSTHQQNNDILQRGLRVRNPYVDPLNIIQAEVLKRLRRNEGAFGDEGKGDLSQQETALLTDALAISINGIANGQKNTG